MKELVEGKYEFLLLALALGVVGWELVCAGENTLELALVSTELSRLAAPFLDELLLMLLADLWDFFLDLCDLDEELVSSEFFDLFDGDPDFDFDDPCDQERLTSGGVQPRDDRPELWLDPRPRLGCANSCDTNKDVSIF